MSATISHKKYVHTQNMHKYLQSQIYFHLNQKNISGTNKPNIGQVWESKFSQSILEKECRIVGRHPNFCVFHPAKQSDPSKVYC